MLQIQHDKSVRVGILASQSDTVSASTACHIGAINTDICGPISFSDQTLPLGRALIDVVDVSVCWVVTLCLSDSKEIEVGTPIQ